MTAATWLAIFVLGPGSVTVFVLFLRDLRKVLGEPRSRTELDRHDRSRRRH